MKLAVVILTCNVRELSISCLESIYKSEPEAKSWQIIVVDNASSDGTVGAVRKRFGKVGIIESPKNVGFAAGNNLAMRKIRAEYVLFLNPDTVVTPGAISKSVAFLALRPEVGSLTCRVDLPDRRLDYSCHRGFPTPWNALCYFGGLAKMFPKVKLFSGYTATYQDLSRPHEIDCGSGTFFLVRYEAGARVGWWDEDYMWNGEDIEFCFRLRQMGYHVYFYPEARIVHYKGSTSGLWSTAKKEVPLETKLRSAKWASQAMRIFYRKHYLANTPKVVAWMIEKGIDALEKRRLAKLIAGQKYE